SQLEAAATLGGALEPKMAAERQRQLVRDRETQPGAAAPTRPERPEDPLALRRPDPRAAVVDHDVDRPVGRAQLEADPPAVGRPAEGVRQQIRDDLEHAIAVRDDHGLGVDPAAVLDSAPPRLLA